MGADPDAVWSDPKNERLRKQRNDPAVLCPGDVLYVPDDDPPPRTVTAGSTNRFKARTGKQTVKLVLGAGTKLANAACVVRGLGADIHTTTGSDGSLSVPVPLDVDTFTLELTERKTTYRVRVGHLDPVSEDSGVRQRLSNLGYGTPLFDLLGAHGVDLDPSFAVSLFVCVFQMANGLAVSGEVDEGTRAALQNAHGA
jgi:hypothetical protein